MAKKGEVERIWAAARLLELERPFWSLSQLSAKIRNSYVVGGSAFEEGLLDCFNHLVEEDQVMMQVGPRRQALYSFGFCNEIPSLDTLRRFVSV